MFCGNFMYIHDVIIQYISSKHFNANTIAVLNETENKCNNIEN